MNKIKRILRYTLFIILVMVSIYVTCRIYDVTQKIFGGYDIFYLLASYVTLLLTIMYILYLKYLKKPEITKKYIKQRLSIIEEIDVNTIHTLYDTKKYLMLLIEISPERYGDLYDDELLTRYDDLNESITHAWEKQINRHKENGM